MYDQLDDAIKLYSDVIKSYAKIPNEGIPENCNYIKILKQNPICGDRIEVCIEYFMYNSEFTIKDIFYEGNGCSLFIASANILKEIVHSKKGEIIYPDYFLLQYSLLKKIIEPTHPEVSKRVKLKPFEGVKKFQSRKSCVLLPWEATDEAIKKERLKCGEIQ